MSFPGNSFCFCFCGGGEPLWLAGLLIKVFVFFWDGAAGACWALEVFREAGFEARGCDVSPEAVDRARELGFEMRCRDIEEAGEEDPVVSGVVDVLVS